MKKSHALIFALFAVPILFLGYSYDPNNHTTTTLINFFNNTSTPNASNISTTAGLSKISTRKVYVPATAAPFDTEINLKKWQIVTIAATGEVNGCRFSNDGAYKTVGPKGWDSTPAFNENKTGPLSKEYPFMALAYRIGNANLNSQDWKFAGDYQEFEANTSGRLFLVANDKFKNEKGKPHKDCWSDNIGGFDVIITIANPTVDCKNNKDISKVYAVCNGRIFNKITETIFSAPQEFLSDSSCSDFSYLIYDEVTKLPEGLTFINGKKLTKEEKTKIETTNLEGKPVKRK